MRSSDGRLRAGAALRGLALAGLLAGCPVGRADPPDGPDPLELVRARGAIEIAVYADFPPYSSGTTPAQARGIDVDLAAAIAEKLGVKLKLRLIAAGESVSDDLKNHVWKGHYLGGGVADVMLHVGYDPAFAGRESNVVLFEPYFHEAVVLAYLPSRIKNVDSPIALTEHRIAVEGDTISDHIMSSAYGGALRNSAVREQSLEEAVAAFKAGEVDGVMGPAGELQGLMAEQRMTGTAYHAQERVGQMRTAWDVAIAVKSTESASLREAVANIVDQMKKDGSMKQVFESYGVNYIDASTALAGKQQP